MGVLEEHEDINLVILDIKRSDMDGVLFLKYLKERERFRKIRKLRRKVRSYGEAQKRDH